ncbi:hypothetical protein Pan181_31750 [Aeoliella mucimassa]|uniref:Uncharacterized protein n=1 Tax=Aeoliella mucimassa TaxID=2527972 RepID=A0A518AQG4_9BACT|nr:hypothetical protein Pan181_31750 [Aeoliella mucimassa]
MNLKVSPEGEGSNPIGWIIDSHRMGFGKWESIPVRKPLVLQSACRFNFPIGGKIGNLFRLREFSPRATRAVASGRWLAGGRCWFGWFDDRWIRGQRGLLATCFDSWIAAGHLQSDDQLATFFAKSW